MQQTGGRGGEFDSAKTAKTARWPGRGEEGGRPKAGQPETTSTNQARVQQVRGPEVDRRGQRGVLLALLLSVQPSNGSR